MKCIHLNIRSAIFVIITVLFNGVKHTHMASSNNTLNSLQQKNHTEISYISEDVTLECPSHLNCSELHYPCIKCNLNYSCIYGSEVSVQCTVPAIVQCIGERTLQRQMFCKYCYQTEIWEHKCTQKWNCNSVATPAQYYKTNCTVNDNVICLGQRSFPKRVRCNWTSGHRWWTALILSITLGGFGADRFYLGHWQHAIGKLFSFGGLGVWTLVDVVLISMHYLGPADGSLYI